MRKRVAPLVVGLALLGVASGCDRVEPQALAARKAALSEPEPTSPIATQQAQLAAVSKARVAPVDNRCPADMVLVEGDYCPKVELNCKRFQDPEGRYEHFRCAEYGPSTCKSKQRKHLRYCIDKHEYVPPGEDLPANHKSFTHAEKTCKSLGKRVCMESEWNFACEGEEMRPYPYGFSRDADACNADRQDIVATNGELRDLRAPPGSHPRCASPFGVLDLSGNLEEFVAIDGSTPVRPAMKGAYWQPGRNFCRAAQTAHDRYYNGTETGFRCCSEAK
ncbi:MAG: formylglycine-generating enzyme family protein [Myxococcota bacterium]